MMAAGVLLLVLSAPPPSEPARFGRKLEGLAVTPLAEVLARPSPGRRVRLEGRVDKVCRRKGCWLELVDGSSAVQVRFEGYAFFVPADLVGKRVALEGRLVVEEPEAGDVAHLKEEGAGAAAAARVSVEASGVEVLR
jgi:hypothetical protein